MIYSELEKMVLALSEEDRGKLLQALLGRYRHEAHDDLFTGVSEGAASYPMNKGVGAMELQLKLLLEKLIHLPPRQQAEVSDFVDFLHQRNAPKPIRSEQQGMVDLLGQLDWDSSFDYKQERSRK